MPVAYPILYDLGTGIVHASQRRCIGGGSTYNKIPVPEEWDRRRSAMKDDRPAFSRQGSPDDRRRASRRGNLHDAYIPAPLDSLTGPLFRDPASPAGGGIGLYKLDLPQNFHVFSGNPAVFQQTISGMATASTHAETSPTRPATRGSHRRL